MSTKYKKTGKNYRARKTKKGEDFFPTYHNLSRRILDALIADYLIPDGSVFLEPCAGAGDITKTIKEKLPNSIIIQIDIKPRNAEIIKDNFITTKEDYACDIIFTNTPFTLFLEFFTKSTEYAKYLIALICPLDYLHSVERYETIYKKGYNGFRLHTCYVFVRRPLFNEKYHPAGNMPTGATSFCVLAFRNSDDFKDPIIKWIDINEEMGIPWAAEQITIFDSNIDCDDLLYSTGHGRQNLTS